MRYLAILFVFCLLMGCNEKPPARTVFDSQLKTIQKARAVEGQLQRSAEQRAEQVEKNEDGK